MSLHLLTLLSSFRLYLDLWSGGIITELHYYEVYFLPPKNCTIGKITYCNNSIGRDWPEQTV